MKVCSFIHSFIHSFFYALAMLKHAWVACLWQFSSCSYPGQSCAIVISKIPQSSFMLSIQSIFGPFSSLYPMHSSKQYCLWVSAIIHSHNSENVWKYNETVVRLSTELDCSLLCLLRSSYPRSQRQWKSTLLILHVHAHITSILILFMLLCR